MGMWDDSEHPDTHKVRDLKAENERLRAAALELIEHFRSGKYLIGDRSISEAVDALERELEQKAEKTDGG